MVLSHCVTGSLVGVPENYSQLIDYGGERGTRTLDLGIMSATL